LGVRSKTLSCLLQNFREDENRGRDGESYSDERVDPGGWMVSNWRMQEG